MNVQHALIELVILPLYCPTAIKGFSMRLMTAVDQLFLLLESRKQPMHVGGLFLFELPEEEQGKDSEFVYQLVNNCKTLKCRQAFHLIKY